MKKLLVLFFSICSYLGFSQVYDPVTWTTSVEKVSEFEYKLITSATIEDGWHLYSQHVPEGGPVPTTFSYNDSS